MGDSPRLKAGRSIELGSEASVTAIRCMVASVRNHRN
jgi:hypothetical protein